MKNEVQEAIKVALRRIRSMTKPQRIASLKNAGILTKAGNLAKPYRADAPKLRGWVPTPYRRGRFASNDKHSVCPFTDGTRAAKSWHRGFTE